MTHDSTAHSFLKETILARKTEKVLRDPATPADLPAELETQVQQLILEDLETAGWAPFHYPRGVAGIAESWRAYVLSAGDAHAIGCTLVEELKITSKEPLLAGGCSALILVTWLPEEDPGSSTSDLVKAKQRARDEEHLAATSAMIQNLLLLLTSRGLGTYWSSGGILRDPQTFDMLGISPTEKLLAAVFVEHPSCMDETAERKPGKLRDSRCTDWIRTVRVD